MNIRKNSNTDGRLLGNDEITEVSESRQGIRDEIRQGRQSACPDRQQSAVCPGKD